MPQPVRVGIIGFGMSAQTFHAPVISRVTGLKLTVIGSSKPDVVHAKYPDVAVCPVDDVLIHPDVDVVVITAPSGLHYDLCKRALLAGKHLLCEKPVTTNEAEALELIELSEKTGKFCLAYQNRRFVGDFLTIKKLISEDKVGDVKTYEAHYDRFRPLVRARWREQAGPGAGLLYDLGSHLLDQTIVLFGMPTELTADIGYQRNGPTDDFFHIVLKYASGTRAILHTSSFAPYPGPTCQVHGTKGSFIKSGMDPQEDQLKRGMQPGDPGYGEEPAELYGTLAVIQNEDGSKLDVSRVPTLPGCYQVLYEELRDAVIANSDQSVITIRDAAKTAKLIDACIKSSNEKRTIIF